MLTGKLINPDIMAALSRCGHGDRVLISDGNYPLNSKSGTAAKIFLGLTAGIPTVTDVLAAVQSEIVVEDARVMEPADGSTPEIFSEFTEMLGGMELKRLGRYDFYDECCKDDVRVAISTGDRRRCANILITIGVA